MSPTNEAIPFYEPGGRISAHATVALSGMRFVTLDGAGRQSGPELTDETSGANYKVKPPSAGGWALGVTSHDAPQGSKVTVLCDPGMIVPVLAANPLTAGDEIETDATGKAIPRTTGISLGRCMASCPAGLAGEVKLR